MTAAPQATLLDGKHVASLVRQRVAEQVSQLQEQGVTPGLAVVQVGDVAASTVYVNKKVKIAAKLGIHSVLERLPASVREVELLSTIDRLNADPAIHAILVQLPLPTTADTQRVQQRVLPHKDVDGFHPHNLGLLLGGGRPHAVACTPKGVMTLLDHYELPLQGQHAVVIGRSTIVGKPQAQLLLERHATVTIAHSRTADLPALCRTADIIVAAVGRPRMVTAHWVKPGATVIDVGINRLEDGQLCGDVAFDEVLPVAGAVTPVPGGVGPLTIATLMENTVALCAAAHGKSA